MNGWVALARACEASWNDRHGRGLAQFLAIGGHVTTETLPERLEDPFYDELRRIHHRRWGHLNA